jgi:hypothetical protein
MKRRITFLLTVFIVLLAAIVLIGWISKMFIFGKLEPPFLGALVAAGGTIFAACIAYSAAIENLRIAQKAVETAEKRQADAEAVTRSERRTRNVRELDQMQHLKDFLERLLTQFAGALLLTTRLKAWRARTPSIARPGMIKPLTLTP